MVFHDLIYKIQNLAVVPVSTRFFPGLLEEIGVSVS